MTDKITPTNKEFADAVFHGLPDGAHIYGTAFAEAPDLAPNGVWFGGAIRDRALRNKSNYTRGDCNTFYVVSSFYPDVFGKVYRRKAQFAAAHVLTMDDIGDGSSAKISWDKVVLEPSFVIETSEDNCQVGYILETPVTDADYFNRTVDALIHQGLAAPVDPGMVGVTRYVRFPVGVNNKTKYVPAWQHVCREWHPERKYRLKDIIDAYGLTLTPPKAQTVGNRAVIAAHDDAYLKVFETRGDVLTGEVRDGGEFDMVDILCPWHEEHTDRVDVGTVYVIGGGFSCFHGHCIDRKFADVKLWLGEQGYDVDKLDDDMRTAREQVMEHGLRKLAQHVIKKGTTNE